MITLYKKNDVLAIELPKRAVEGKRELYVGVYANANDTHIVLELAVGLDWKSSWDQNGPSIHDLLYRIDDIKKNICREKYSNLAIPISNAKIHKLSTDDLNGLEGVL